MPKIVGYAPNPESDDPAELLYGGEAALIMNPLNWDLPVLGFVVAGGQAYFAWERTPGSDAKRIVVQYLTENDPAALGHDDSWSTTYENLASGVISPTGAPAERGVYNAAKAASAARYQAFTESGDPTCVHPFIFYFVDDKGDILLG